MYGDRIDTNYIICHLTIDGLTRSDIGKAQGSEGPKAAYSDAFKRAAVKFGIGVSLYAMSRVWLDVSQQRQGGLAKTGRGEKQSLTITTKPTRGSAGGTRSGSRMAAAPCSASTLDHGDAPGSVGAAIEGSAPAPEDDEPQGTIEFAAKRAGVEKLYDERVKEKPALKRKMSKAKLAAMLNGCDKPADIDAVAAKVRELNERDNFPLSLPGSCGEVYGSSPDGRSSVNAMRSRSARDREHAMTEFADDGRELDDEHDLRGHVWIA